MTLAADGVFPAAVDKSAFIDTLRVSVWGTRRDTPISGVRDLVKEPIGGKRSKYGWIDRGIFVSTGNRYELVYGPLRSRGILPPIVLTLRSDQTPITVEEAREVLRSAPGILIVDKHEPGGYVTPHEAAGEDATYVSRLREDPTVENGLAFWCVSDNLRKGAALNAVQIAEVLINRGLITGKKKAA